jgi:hypothetical protein
VNHGPKNLFNPINNARDETTQTMQCERLIKQIKTWYLHVQNETMAPARMISFIENHASQCDICLADPDLPEEITKITKIILPESMIPKAVRLQNDDREESALTDEEAVEETDENEGGNEQNEDDDEENELELFDLDDEI